MFNLLRRFEFPHGRFTRSAPLPPAADSFLSQFIHSSSSPANAAETSSKESDIESFSAVYLRNEHGVSETQITSCSKYLKFDSLGKPLSVIAFLKNHHFSDSQVSTIVKKWPLIFRYVPETSFLPKIEYLRELGFSSTDIVKIVTVKPNLLDRSLDSQIIPCVDFLRSFLNSDKDVMRSILRFPGILRESLQKTLLPNVDILRGVCVPESHIGALLRTNPRRISVDPNTFRSTVEEVLKLGFDPLTKTFIAGLIVMRQLSSSSWQDKIEYFGKWGCSEDQMVDVIRRNPKIMAVSKDKIGRILDFMVETMECDVSFFVRRPGLLLLSFETRIVPRFEFYRALLSKGLVKQSSLRDMLFCPESSFVERYVVRFEERDCEVLKVYEEIFSRSKA